MLKIENSLCKIRSLCERRVAPNNYYTSDIASLHDQNRNKDLASFEKFPSEKYEIEAA